MQLKDKVTIVTGGSKGIGEGIVRKFVAEGAQVVIADIDEDANKRLVDELTATRAAVSSFVVDVSSADMVAALFSDTLERYGRVDIVVNNAGIYPFVSCHDMTEQDWDKVLGVNLKGVHLVSREAAKTLQSGGRIITISSIASIIGFTGLTHYCASKAGVNGYTRALSLELAPKQITVNAIAPGAIDTPGIKSSGMSEEAQTAMIAQVPAGRYGTPADIAHAATFLAAPEASYVTGQVIVVDGGWTVR